MKPLDSKKDYQDYVDEYEINRLEKYYGNNYGKYKTTQIYKPY